MTHHTRWLNIGGSIRVTLHYREGQRFYVLSLTEDRAGNRITFWPLEAWVLRAGSERTIVEIRMDGNIWNIERAARFTPGQRAIFSPVQLAA